MLPVQKCWEIVQFSKKNAKFMLTLMLKEKFIFLLQIQILHFKYIWNLHSLSLAWFFLIQNGLRPMWLCKKQDIQHSPFGICRCTQSICYINNKIYIIIAIFKIIVIFRCVRQFFECPWFIQLAFWITLYYHVI